MDDQLVVKVEEIDGIPILNLEGELDSYNKPKLLEKVMELLKQGKKSIIIDFSLLKFIDAGGTGGLVSVQARCREHGTNLVLVLTNDSRTMMILEVTKLFSIFTIKNSISEAVKASCPARGFLTRT